MKKLISVFAALALVGSLAAQKKPAAKAPAKPAAPAAPAVAAPAAPAIAAPAAAPAPGASGKGMGLFVEGRGTFTLVNGTSSSRATGDVSQTGYDFKLPSPSGFGGGGTIGYEIANNLGLVASFDYRSVSSRKWESTKNDATSTIGGGTMSQAIQNVKNTMIIGLGLRPSVNALGGVIYAGAGVAYLLPYTDTTTVDLSDFTASAGLTIKREIKSEWNSGIGAYGELGYNYSITDNLYLGLGVRLVVVTANNDGKKQTTTTTPSTGSATTSTTEYSATQAAGKSAYTSDGTTDFGAAVSVGFRF